MQQQQQQQQEQQDKQQQQARTALPLAPPPPLHLPTAMEEDAHYQDVAAAYESAFFYGSEDYMQHIVRHLLHHLRADEVRAATRRGPRGGSRAPTHAPAHRHLPPPCPRQSSTLADIGGGTGNFTQRLAAAAGLRRRALCVDPAADMLALAAAHPLVEPMLLDAVGFARLPPERMRYSHALLKEVVHHIPRGEVAELYSGVASQLEPGGCVVTVTRPQEVDYPLFQRAREVGRSGRGGVGAGRGGQARAGQAGAGLHPPGPPRRYGASTSRQQRPSQRRCALPGWKWRCMWQSTRPRWPRPAGWA